QSPEAQSVQALLARIAYDNVARSKGAVNELNNVLQQGLSPTARQEIALGLRDVIVNIEFGNPGAAPAIRDLRQAVLRTMKSASRADLGRYFNPYELEHLDLFGMDFSGTDLQGISFKGSFLVEATFERCNLAQASFAEAYIRNCNFQETDL